MTQESLSQDTTRPGGLGTAYTAVEVGRKRHFSACADEDASIQSPEITVGDEGNHDRQLAK